MKKHPEVFAAFLLFLIHALFFHAFLRGGVVFGSDAVLQNYPVRVLTQAFWQELGRIPWWNPYSYSGMPLCGTFASLCFYPLSRASFVFPPHIGMNLLVVFHSLLGTCSLYAFLRSRSYGTQAVLFGAFMYAFGGFMSQHLFAGHLDALATIHWFPVILLCWSLHFRDQRFFWVFIAGAALAMQILAGYPQYVYLTHLVGIPAWFWMAEKPMKHIHVVVVYFIFGLALSAIQWMPAMNILKESVRSAGSGEGFFSAYALTFKDIWSLIIPHIWGDGLKQPYQTTSYGWEVTAYLSLVGILMMTQANLRKRPVRIAWGLFVIFILLALGSNIPGFFEATQAINPFSKMFRVPGRYLICATLMATYLAVEGFENLQRFRWLRRYSCALVALLIADLYLVHARYYKTTSLSRFSDIQFHPEEGRFFSLDSDLKFQSQNLIHRRYHAAGYDPMVPKHYNEFLNLSVKQREGANQAVFFPGYFPKALGEAGVRWIIADHEVNDPEFKLYGRQGKYVVYEYARHKPRFYFQGEKTGLSDFRIQDLADHIDVSFAPSDKMRNLIIADNFYPGWIAKSNGQPIEMTRFEGFKKRLTIPAKVGSVTLTFVPIGYSMGRITTIVSGIFWCFALLICTLPGVIGWSLKKRI